MSGATLAGQVAIVTGAGRGIGRAVALELAARGASVALAARSAGQVEAVAGEIEATGGRALPVAADVTDRAAVDALAAATAGRLGRVTLLVNNAGAWRGAGPLAAVDPDAWWDDVEVTLRGAFLAARAVLPAMLAAGQGRIVNVSSYAALSPRPLATAYAAGKAALLRLTDSLDAETAERGVRAFAVSPGFVRTGLVEDGPAARVFPELAERTDALEPERTGRLVAEIASGRLDPLAGRFLHVLDDLDDLLRRAGEIRERDLYALRMRTLRDA